MPVKLRVNPLIICLLIFTGMFSYSQEWKTYPYTPEGGIISFPADEGRHSNEPVEWWYLSGHFTGNNSGDEYAFMLTYFHFPFAGFEGFRILNIFNLTSGQHISDSYPCNYEVMASDSLNIQAVLINRPLEYLMNKTDIEGNIIPFEYSLFASAGNSNVSLEFVALKPPLIVGDSGYFNQGSEGYTYYYAQTMLELTGNIKLGTNDEEITGKAWLDRQYGNFNPYQGEKYEWFAIQLSNGIELNFWNIFTEDNNLPLSPEYTLASVMLENNEKYFSSDININRIAYKFTSDGEICYASKWNLFIEDIDLNIEFEIISPDHENYLPFRFLEGPITAKGYYQSFPVTGQGFAELLHSYSIPEPEFIYPLHKNYWHNNIAPSWMLKNPDEGNPATYKLSLCDLQGNEKISIPVPGNINSYYINPGLFSSSDSVILSISAFSSDSTLKGNYEIKTGITPIDHFFYLPEGSELSLSAGIKDNGLNFQWFKDNKILDGYNDSVLHISLINEIDHGVYFCQISNSLFSANTINFYVYSGQGEVSYQKAYICAGDSFNTGTRWIKAEGLYVDSLKTIYGRDSLLVTDLFVSICTGINNKYENESFFNVYCDASGNIFNILFERSFTGQFRLINMRGNIINSNYLKDTNSFEIDLSGKPPGIYLIQLYDKQVFSVKIVKIVW